MNYDQLDHEYQSQLRQFVQSAIGKEPHEMRILVIEFFPTFIAKTAEDIRIGVDTRDKGLAGLQRIEARITLHGEHRKDRKQREKILRLLKHNESLFERCRILIDHFESLRISFDVILPELKGMSDDVTADSRLPDLFPQLYIGNPA